MALELNVEVREQTGRRNMKRLRAEGKTPAVIYGQGKDSVSLAVPTDELNRLIHDGQRILTLSGGLNEDAFIRDVQWDLYGIAPLHVDFTRVKAGELIETTVAIDVRGEAAGTKLGGKLETAAREMVIACPPRSMTDRIEVDVTNLGIGEKISLGDVTLPEGAELVSDANMLIAQVVEKDASAATADEESAPAADGAEPEVIGEKKGEAGDDS